MIHKPRLKSGIPIRGGLARLAAIAFMVKSYTITDWTAFAEVFGMPLRLGRYGQNASEARHSQADLGGGEPGHGRGGGAAGHNADRVHRGGATGKAARSLYEKLAVYLDKQVSKAVLGQTMTADDGSSRAQAQVHDEVRGDILRSDARQLEDTLNRDMVKPFIDLNYGPQESYPRLMLPVPEPEDIKVLAEALGHLVPLGLRVEASVIRDKLGLPDPEEGAEVLTALAAAAEPPEEPERAGNRRLGRAANRAASDEIEELIERGGVRLGAAAFAAG